MSGCHPSFSASADSSSAFKSDPTKTLLSTNWFFKQVKSDNPVVPSFLPCRTLPTEIHLDLLSHNLIPDPFLKQNENDVQWIGEEPWLYRTAFHSPTPASPATRTFLVFDGLDTFATVTLNGSVILQSENMFIPHRIDVTSSLLLLDSENVLEILFESAFLRGKQIRNKYPNFSWGCWNGDSSRLAVRKAQYHYGWDWGPILMTCGPWKAVYLESFVNRVAELQAVVELDTELRNAKVQVKAEVEGSGDKVIFRLTAPDGGIQTLEAGVRDGLAEGEFVVKEPELWWPIGYGAQKLYTLTATTEDGATLKKRFGIRSARVVQKELVDQEGSTFFFEINGVPIWVGGSNWIPADNFLTRVDEAGYRPWLNLLRDGNQIMVR
jgi:beta-mannosidase